MKNKLFTGFILLFAVVVLAFQTTFAQNGKVRKEMLVTTDWLAKNLKAKDVTILHIAANKANYDKAHIENARFVAWNELMGEQKKAGEILFRKFSFNNFAEDTKSEIFFIFLLSFISFVG